jgi:hypothetical protein
MVHALEESWRILAPGGQLVDIRPLTSNPPLEVIYNEEISIAGQVDDSVDTPSDIAANEAAKEVVNRGIFLRQQEERFEFAYYWDKLEDMEAYIEDQWSDWVNLPQEVSAKARRLTKDFAGNVQYRVQVDMLISRYKKQVEV